ncbi:MAG: hypothetical protein J0M33_15825 [Anaerolineae bacterium]|nr:hypothetical protein [Anaerolineae bacterium]
MNWKSVSGVLVVILITTGFAILFISRQIAQSNDPIPCLENIPDNLTSTEISERLGIPIVVVEPLPTGILSDPEITVDIDYPLESPVCGVRVKYFSNANPRPEIEIRVFKAAVTEESSDWYCLDYPASEQPIDGQLRSVCGATLSSESVRLFIRVSTQRPSEETLSIARQIKLEASQ